MASVVVMPQNTQVIVASPTGDNDLVEVVTRGPQGPVGVLPSGAIIVDDAAKIDKSIVYYDAPSSSYKADAIWTTSTIVDGANF